MFELLVTSGPAADLRIEVGGELVLGREGSDVILADAEASRRHAVVRPAQSGLEIEDLGSTNGTFVNDARISEPTTLKAGDTIRIGASSIQVESDEIPTTETVVSPIPVADAARPQATVAAPTSTPAAEATLASPPAVVLGTPEPISAPAPEPTPVPAPAPVSAPAPAAAPTPVPAPAPAPAPVSAPPPATAPVSAPAPAAAPPVAPDPGAAPVAAGPEAGPISPQPRPRRGRADSRRLGPTAFSVGLIVVTAIALILYFLLR